MDPLNRWVGRESHVATHQMNATISNAFMLIKNAMSFNYTNVKNQQWIEKALERVCSNVTCYVQNATVNI